MSGREGGGEDGKGFSRPLDVELGRVSFFLVSLQPCAGDQGKRVLVEGARGCMTDKS